MPVGAYGGRKEIMDLISPCGPVYQAGTLSGNPVAMAAGFTQLKYLYEHQEIYKDLAAKGEKLYGCLLYTSKDWRNFMKNKPYFPMFIDLSDKNIDVAGGGNIATRRIKTLLKFTRNITVVATKVTQELMDLGKAGTVTLYIRPVKRSDFANEYMVIAATNDWKLNDEIHRVFK